MTLSDAELAMWDPMTLAMWHQPRHFAQRPHLALIASEFARAANTLDSRTLIVCPPQVGKSTLAAVYGAAWYLVGQPHRRIVIGSYADSLARTHGKDVRTIVRELGTRFGTGIAHGSASVSQWRTPEGGGLRSVGVGAGLTGHPADLAIVDDPEKDQRSAMSPVKKDDLRNWWSSVLTTRLSPGAPIFVIMTRWAIDDLAGWLLSREGRLEEGGKWRIVHMPAIADLALTPFGDPLGRADGDPLSHPKVPDGDRQALLDLWAMKKASVLPRDWAALYQGDPAPAGGTLLAHSDLERVRAPLAQKLPPAVRILVGVDPSGGGRDDAGIIGGYLGTDGLAYLTHDYSGHMASHIWAERAVQLAIDTHAHGFVVEKNYGGDMCTAMIRRAWKDAVEADKVPAGMWEPAIQGKTARGTKAQRAAPVAQKIRSGQVRLAASLPDLAHEWATWSPLSPVSPGRIDAAVHLVRALLPDG